MLSLLKKKLSLANDEGARYIDESLSPVDRLRFLLRSDDSTQRQACSKVLVDSAFEIGYESTLKCIIPIWRDLLDDVDAQVRSLTIASTSDLAGCIIQGDYEAGYVSCLNACYYLQVSAGS